MKKKYTTIRISKGIHQELQNLGAEDESFESVIVSLLEERYHLIREIKGAMTIIKALLLNPNLPSGDLHDDVRQILKELLAQMKSASYSMPRHQRNKEYITKAQFNLKKKESK